jgi:hypothetical protein
VAAAPPDTDGAVGPNHYVQTVNTAIAIFNKSGLLLYGPVNTNTLWTGFVGGNCASQNQGQAIVEYDRLADRFVVTQHAFALSSTGTPVAPYEECVAVSTTPDPTGTYYRYSFGNFGTMYPDAPKLGIWPDAYYITFDLFSISPFAYNGPRFCAYDRVRMLQGLAATQQCFTEPNTYGADLPSDLDGPTPPPAGEPNFILEWTTTSTLSMWKFHVDWTTPANTTLTGPSTITVPGFSVPCGGSGGACVPQLGTAQLLDSLANSLMQRLAYRNFGDHEALVANHSVDQAGVIGVRWYELRSPATPTVYQQGTYVPDSNYRWAGSIAQDHAGDIALEFSISSGARYPGMHYAGRLVTDPLGMKALRSTGEAHRLP